MSTKIKKILSQILFVSFIVCLINSSTLMGMKKKTVAAAHKKTLLDLPDELLVLIVFFMFGDNHGNAISTTSLVCKETHKKIMQEKLYAQFIPGLKPEFKFIRPYYKRTIPRISFYLVTRGTEMICDGAVKDVFLETITEKGYLKLEFLIPAYGIAKEESIIKDFLYKQIDKLLLAFADEIDKNEEKIRKDDSTWKYYSNKFWKIDTLIAAHWCSKPFLKHTKKIDKKFDKIAFGDNNT